MDVKVKPDYIKIFDSYQFSKIDFNTCLDYIESNYDTDVFNYRTRKSLRREWAIHNILYRWGINRKHTADVTFEIPISKCLNFWYNFLGAIAMLYID